MENVYSLKKMEEKSQFANVNLAGLETSARKNAPAITVVFPLVDDLYSNFTQLQTKTTETTYEQINAVQTRVISFLVSFRNGIGRAGIGAGIGAELRHAYAWCILKNFAYIFLLCRS